MITYTFIFEPDYPRIMFAVIIDSKSTQVASQVGAVIKYYVDGQLAMVGENGVVYRIETNEGVLAGFFVIEVNTANKTAVLQQFVLRSSFQQFQAEISGNITNFIQNNEWQGDFLF